MNVKFYAQPYDISATGFYFETADELRHKTTALWNAHGELVEEFEIQVIDGEPLDIALATAIGVQQGDIAPFLDCLDAWDDHQKHLVIVAVGELGYRFDLAMDDPDDFDIDLYQDVTMRDLAEDFVEEGLYGDIPEQLAYYIDYDAIARDLAVDYSETEIAGTRFIYRAA